MVLDHYKVEVLHYVNPYLIWVLVQKAGEEKIYFEQIGIYGILPQNITFEVDCVVKTERCEHWMPAAVFVMKNAFIEAAEVWFSPTYIDKKISIFDDNTHKYGDIVIIQKDGTQLNLLEEIIKSRFAFEDECLFHQELRDNNLKTELNYITALDVISKIEEAYKTRDIPKNLWQNALKNQTTVLKEAKHIETIITTKNLEIHDHKNIDTLLKNKLNDLKLCKDVDEDSAGRACSMRNSRPSSVLSVSLKKKMDLLKAHNKDVLKPVTADNYKNTDYTESKSNGDPFEDQENIIVSPNRDKKINEDKNNNVNRKKAKKTRNTDTKLVAFGPAGLQKCKFNIKPQPTEEPEELPIQEKSKQEPEKEEEEVLKQERDVYENTDSEVNLKVSNIDILKEIQSKHSILNNSIENKCKSVDTKLKSVVSKGESLSAMRRKIKYIEDKMAKVNESLSSNSDKDSSKIELDSDGESITALEEKLGLSNKKTKTDVDTEPQLDSFDVDVLKCNVNPFNNLDGSISIFIDKLVSPVLMVHTKSDNRIQPVSNLRDIPFGDDIHIALKNMSIKKPMRPQTISWPTILRGHSFFLIGPYHSGNTIGYLPAVCRLVSDFKNTHNNFGLSCVIVCATSHSVAAVESICKMFLHTAKIFSCYAGISDMNITTALLNGCDILICTPSMLVRLIQEDFSLDFRNLSAFVVDDCERVSKVYPNELKFCLRKVMDIVKNRANKEWKVQYIMVSRIWCDFMSSLARKAPDSVVCISAFEECVLYSKAATSVEFVLQENKLDTVIDFLKGIDGSKKTVIVCRADEEVQALEKALTKLKYVVFACNSSMDVQELYNLDKILKEYEEPVSGPVLICCDGNLTHLNVTDAHYLVHYSMPVLFSMFCKRFAVLIDNYASIFKTEESNVKIKILLDNNIEQLPKILHFIKRCTTDIPAFLDEISTKILFEKNFKKAQNLVPLCKRLLTLGICPDFWNCMERHAIFKDYDGPKAWLPKEGVITFQILHYHSAVLYSARITSCMAKSNTTKYPQTYSLLSIKMGMYYSKEANRRLHGVPKIGDVCAVTLKQNLFVRCQVLKVVKSINNQPSLLLINLIDEEKYEIARDTWLYYLPDDLKNIETHVVQVILANLTPQDKDVTFSKLALNRLRKITEENDDLYMRGHIKLVVGNIVFVDTLEACQDLSSLEEIVVKYDFRKELLDGHALDNPNHIDNLMKLSDYTVCEHEEEVQRIEVPKPIKILPKGRWAHLESDGFSSVFFMFAENPCEFFVRPIQFDGCLTTLIKDIKKYVTENPEPVENVIVGDIVLAEFPDDATFERARIDGEVLNNKYKCFFVDQAEWREVSDKKILPINEKFITQLPFQAIECKLVGLEPVGDHWSDFSTNFFVDSCYDSVDNLKQLYTKYFTKEKAVHTDGHKYGVVLIDTYSDEDVIINQILLDKNLAGENEEFHYLNNLAFKRNSVESSDSDIDEELKQVVPVVTNDKVVSIPQLGNKLPGKLIRSVPLVDSDDDFDSYDFMADVSGKIGSIPITELAALCKHPPANLPKKSKTQNQNPAVTLKNKNVTSEHVSKPKLLWRQNNTTVNIKIKLIVDNYDVIIKERYIKFSAEANDTIYGFDFELYGVVNLNKSSHSNKGQYILIKLWKVMARNWLTLTRDSANKKWIVYDVDSIDVSSDEEPESDILDVRKNIIHNVDESDSDDNLQDDSTFSYKRE